MPSQSLPPSKSPVVLQIQSDASSSPFHSGNGAQYLYGFTITFVALFVAFATCAYSSRRGNRRRAMAFDQIDWNVSADGNASLNQLRPKYDEVWLDEKAACHWGDISPLAAMLVRDSNDTSVPIHKRLTLDTNITNPNDHPRTSLTGSPDSPFYSEAHGYRVPYIPPQLTTFIQQRTRTSSSGARPPDPAPLPPEGGKEKSEPPTSPVRGVQVAMLINMPCPVPLQKRRASEQGLGDVVLGVASIPWEEEIEVER